MARPSAFRIVRGELRGAVTSVATLATSMRQGAAALTRWRGNGVRRRASRASQAREAEERAPEAPQASDAEAGSPLDPTAADLRYRIAIRALVRHIIALQAGHNGADAAALAPSLNEHREESVGIEERMVAQRVALERARARRAAWASSGELPRGGQGAPTHPAQSPAIAWWRAMPADEEAGAEIVLVDRKVDAWRAELEDARRRVAQAEALAARCRTLEAQFCWEVLEDVEPDDPNVDLAFDRVKSERG